MNSHAVHESLIDSIAHSGNPTQERIIMEQSLQKFNANQNLLEWSERIASCRNSGMSVRGWCKVNGIPPSTYYNQQRKVFEASKSATESERKPQFTEIRLPKQSHMPTATIRVGDLEADIYPGADEETIRTICLILKSC